jgi:putative transposase
MPARPVIFFPQGHYHIYNRGHNKQSIFLHYKDYQRYLTRLEEYLEKHPVSLLAYCLMPNHIHLLIRQDDEESVERFIHRLHTSYTMYFNRKYERVGSVFQGRFRAKLVETDEYLLHVSRYIHLNPCEILRAHHPDTKLENYPWSSYPQYVGSSEYTVCNTSVIYGYYNGTTEEQALKYRAFVESYIPNMEQSELESISNGSIEFKARP